MPSCHASVVSGRDMRWLFLAEWGGVTLCVGGDVGVSGKDGTAEWGGVTLWGGGDAGVSSRDGTTDSSRPPLTPLLSPPLAPPTTAFCTFLKFWIDGRPDSSPTTAFCRFLKIFLKLTDVFHRCLFEILSLSQEPDFFQQEATTTTTAATSSSSGEGDIKELHWPFAFDVVHPARYAYVC
jgi:hypothetical protein